MVKKKKIRIQKRKRKKPIKTFKKSAREATCRTEDFLERAYRTDFIPDGCRSKRR